MTNTNTLPAMPYSQLPKQKRRTRNPTSARRRRMALQVNRILNMLISSSRERGLDCEDMFLTNLPKATILEEKYPEDAPCEEMGPSARVFRTHLDERAIYDANMAEESRDGVDVLLVFAGLFSAVVTTFVVQTSQSLQAGYTEISANLLFEMINIQRAIASGASLDTVAASPLNSNTTFISSTTSIWVTGLWFTSLALSLTTALVSVLVKQWLHHYVTLPSGSVAFCHSSDLQVCRNGAFSLSSDCPLL
ncbi:hypothetical protein ARMGADRAFT_1010604 [Armillaria gallica]|uniref:DUF6535 domain-containing protein n=1 Tax=Armillaria gallica TaxID=47427 RepID=A0A2H3DPI6_ARMGA|nr:hypothetical protein ARMGADRAFT_1010604 [Armillaria gallica]